MDAYRAIVDKRDQRVYLPKPIPDEALRRILQAARMTGSSKNREPNRLIVVTEREGVQALGPLSTWALSLAAAASASQRPQGGSAPSACTPSRSVTTMSRLGSRFLLLP